MLYVSVINRNELCISCFAVICRNFCRFNNRIVADFFVIATGTSDRQLGALADDVEDKFAELGIEPKSKDGRPDTGWILVDGGDVIVNIFTNDTRDKYTLEKIWSDCESILVD